MKFLLQTQIGIEKITKLELEEKYKKSFSLDQSGYIPRRNGLLIIDWRDKFQKFWDELNSIEDAFFVLEYIKDVSKYFSLKDVIKKIDKEKIASHLKFILDQNIFTDKSLNFRIITRKRSPHNFRRIDLEESLKNFFHSKLPKIKINDDENNKEIWITLVKNRLIITLRLTDKTKRHRFYKHENILGSVRPSVAFAMAYVSDIRSTDTIWDPFAGAGTIPCEILLHFKFKKLLIGDIDESAIEKTKSNLKQIHIYEKLKSKISIRSEDFFSSKRYTKKIITNPPFGDKHLQPENFEEKLIEKINNIPNLQMITLLYPKILKIPGWQLTRKFKLEILGKEAYITVYRKIKNTVYDLEPQSIL
ncbi:MAG: methyltransferase [Candidatus Dojkabacteria bacterium]|nr:methyltransferase [Candidatus Dojkabacteria bacterium]